MKKRGLKPEGDGLQEKLIRINRVSKTVKGGRRISFSVLAAVGDEKGSVGLGLGKANGVPEAIKKAMANARKNMVKVSLKGDTIPHAIVGRFGATKVLLKPAPHGTGVISGSASRDILELAGVHNVVSKILGSRNKGNVARATIEGLLELRTPKQVAELRGKTVQEILG